LTHVVPSGSHHADHARESSRLDSHGLFTPRRDVIGSTPKWRRLAQLTHARADVRQNKARQRCPPGSILSRLSVAAGCVVSLLESSCERRQRPVAHIYYIILYVYVRFWRLVSGARSPLSSVSFYFLIASDYTSTSHTRRIVRRCRPRRSTRRTSS